MAPSAGVRGPLDGVRVIDLSRTVSGAWCGRLLADLGGDVTLVEAPEGHPVRQLAPFAADGRSIVAMYVLANRRSIALAAADHTQLRRLVEAADIIVMSADGGVDALPLPPRTLEQWNPGAVVVAITPHGLTGARAATPGNDLTAFALSGWASVNGLAEREPLKGSGFMASYTAGTAAYGAAVSALIEGARSGAGQCIDIAEDETLLEIFQAGFLRGQYHGDAHPRRRQISVNGTFPVPVGDGHMSLTLPSGERFRDAMLALGMLELAEDERFATPALRVQHEREFSDLVEAQLRQHTREELVETLSVLRISPGPVLYMNEVAEHPQLRARNYFVRPPDAPEGPEYPGAPFKLSRTPWSLLSSAPEIGADTAAVLGAVRAPAPPRRADAEAPSDAPLRGVRAVVLTHAWLGTFCTQLLAFHGAEVIQLEARKRPDVWRLGYQAQIPRALRDRATAEHGWNLSPLFNAVNLGKRGVTLDLSTPEGHAMFLDLVRTADIVVENFSARVMGNLGLDYETLQGVKPDLIMASLCAYGQSGPWRDILGIGGTVEPTSGMSSLLGYPDSQPLNSGQMLPDPVGGYYGFAALVSALWHRERSGEGQFIDLSMQEANHTFVGDASLQYRVTGEVRPRMANRHLTFAPHGIYPAQPLDGGPEQWIALAAESEEQWQTLCAAAEGCDWTIDPRFADNAARKHHEDALDAAIAAWTVTQPRDALAARLAAEGVPAAPVLDGLELAVDAVYRDRGVVIDLDHPEAGETAYIGIPYHFSRTPIAAMSPAPLHGEHSFEVFARILGTTREQYERLEQRGVTGMGPPPGV